jgi:uroporphyrinogen decarboxylase
MVHVPGFLVNKIYERGSLQNTGDGFTFCFKNTMTPLKISGMREVKINVDGSTFPQNSIQLLLGDQAFAITNEPFAKLVEFSKNSRLHINIKGKNLPDGTHVIRISFITNEYGGVSLKVKDVIGAPDKATALQKFKNKFSGKSVQSRFKKIIEEGALGGVPLDPDFSRMETALKLGEPDRVPLFEAEIEMPIQEWFLGREINNAEDEIEFYIKAGYDFVPIVPPFFTPRLMRTASGEERSWITESEGIIKNLQDVQKFPWPNPDEVDFSSFHNIAKILPPKMKTIGLLSPAAIFGNTSQSMGLVNFSYALYDHVDVVEALFEIIGTAYVKIAKRLATMPKLGAVFMSDDLSHAGGYLVSPKVYRKYVFPWYRQIGEIFSKAHIPLVFHSDGRLWDVLDDLVGCGMKGIHPIEPQAMDIVEVKRRYGGKLCIFGNIDLDYTLTRGTVDEVDSLVRKKIKELGPGGGYVLSASNSIPEYVIPENFRAMVEAAKKYGKYPITL